MHGVTPEHVHKAFLEAVDHRFRRAMQQVEGEVRRLAPWRTGHLRRSITSTATRHGATFEGFVGTTTLYAPWLEFGTGIYGPKHRLITAKHMRTLADGSQVPGALRFPSGQGASRGIVSRGRRGQSRAGLGFTQAGRQRSGAAGGQASFTFRRSVKGVPPIRFFEEGVRISRRHVEEELRQVIPDVRKRLGAGR